MYTSTFWWIKWRVGLYSRGIIHGKTFTVVIDEKNSFWVFPAIKNFTQLFLYKCFVVKACQIYDLLSFPGYLNAAQVFHTHVLANTVVDHISCSRFSFCKEGNSIYVTQVFLCFHWNNNQQQFYLNFYISTRQHQHLFSIFI